MQKAKEKFEAVVYYAWSSGLLDDVEKHEILHKVVYAKTRTELVKIVKEHYLNPSTFKFLKEKNI